MYPTITLALIRDMLRRDFGRDSFIASFIRNVIEDPDTPTASISIRGELRYNPHFIEQYVKDRCDIFSLIVHEMLHPMFGHWIYDSRNEIESIAADAVINATIAVVFAHKSNSGSLMRDFYPETGLAGLLRPGSNMRLSRYQALYRKLYDYNYMGPKITAGDVISTLRILTPQEEAREVPLLGSHGKQEGFSREDIGEMAEDMRRTVRQIASRQAGCSSRLCALLLEVIESQRSIKRILLNRFTTQRKVDRFLFPEHSHRISSSPLPLHPSKRDLVLLASGMMPFRYRNTMTQTKNTQRGLAVYLDVSGSVNEYLPQILGLLGKLRHELNSIFLFSTKVVETPFAELLKGHVNTTYGTDFNCVADSMLERRWDRAVVLTDGYAFLAEEKREALKQQGTQTLTLLFGGSNACDEWAGTGEVLELDAVTG